MKKILLLLGCCAFALTAIASPGAHGPNGEHLDDHATSAAGGSVPRVETFTELFELVGSLSGGELSVMIDRYDTNEPVLHGKLEVQFKGLKAQAKFHEDMGDYAIDDPRMLQALSSPGKHQLMFTFIAGDESDLLEGTLEVPAVAAPPAPTLPRWLVWTGASALLLLVVGLLARRRMSASHG